MSDAINYPDLDDSSLMPYGKHKGTKMVDVPDSYLLWIYENDKCSDSVKKYIESNLDAIRHNVAREGSPS
jgi:uncharacterized protein (DUF3820 family)